MRMSRIVVIVLSLFCATSLLADGLRFVNGRLEEGPVTVLELSADQIVQVKTKRVVVLTEEQKRDLIREAGVAPSVLTVYSTKVASAGIDSCFEYNMSVWFLPTKIEVPHRFLISDQKAEAKATEIENID